MARLTLRILIWSVGLAFGCAGGGEVDAAVDSGVVLDTGLDGADGEADSAATADAEVSDATMDASADSAPDAVILDSAIDVAVDTGSGGWTTATLFVTSTAVTAAGVGGLAGADAMCRAAAGGAGLPNATQYVAVMSDSSIDARDRFAVQGEIHGTDGTLLAASSTALWSAGVMARVNRTETGGSAGWHLVWTGTQPTGLKHGTSPSNFCQNWTSDSGGVETGRTDRSDDGWVAIYHPSSPGNACSNPGGVYCVGPR